MVSAKRKVNLDTIILELDEWEAKELADFLNQTDMHMSIGDRKRVARAINTALNTN